MDERSDKERLVLLEAELASVKASHSRIEGSVGEIKALIAEVGRDMRVTFVAREVLEGRFATIEQRITSQEGRPLGVPPWIVIVGTLLITLVSLLGGTLIGILTHKP